MDVLVFGGTSEGRLLAEWLDARGTCEVVYCCATEYGASLVAEGPRVTVLQGPLSLANKRRLIETHDFACFVDATHPYAQHISASIDELSDEYGIDVVRVDREETREQGPWLRARDAGEAARMIAGISGNVLLTTGTKDLNVFVDSMPDYKERLYVRILPVTRSLEIVERLAVPASHVVAMQGPFSVRLNQALIEEFQIRTLVTKQSGARGGFEQKVRAAQGCGIELVIIDRPVCATGMSMEEAKDVLRSRYGA